MSTPPAPALHVYLVEDDPDHALIIGRAIRDVNPQVLVRAVEDGEAAFDALQQAEEVPDLILLDINMPGLSGLDLLARLKTDERYKRIPVVMLTSSELPADVARAYELGASGYISKPGRLHDVRAVLGNTLLYWSAMKRASTVGG